MAPPPSQVPEDKNAEYVGSGPVSPTCMGTGFLWTCTCTSLLVTILVTWQVIGFLDNVDKIGNDGLDILAALAGLFIMLPGWLGSIWGICVAMVSSTGATILAAVLSLVNIGGACGVGYMLTKIGPIRDIIESGACDAGVAPDVEAACRAVGDSLTPLSLSLAVLMLVNFGIGFAAIRRAIAWNSDAGRAYNDGHGGTTSGWGGGRSWGAPRGGPAPAYGGQPGYGAAPPPPQSQGFFGRMMHGSGPGYGGSRGGMGQGYGGGMGDELAGGYRPQQAGYGGQQGAPAPPAPY